MNSELFLTVRNHDNLKVITEINNYDPEYSDGVCDYMVIKLKNLFKIGNRHYVRISDIYFFSGSCEYNQYDNILRTFSEYDMSLTKYKFDYRWYEDVVKNADKNYFWKTIKYALWHLIDDNLRPTNLIKAVIKIQRAWRKCRDDPKYKMCQRVLRRNLARDIGEEWANQFLPQK